MEIATAVNWAGAGELRKHLQPIGDLKPWPGNAHKGNVPELAASLKRFGQVRAVLTLEDGTIVAGHHVVEAAKLLGWTHISAIPATFETRDDARDYLLADNQLSTLGSDIHEDQMTLLEEVERRGSWEGTGFSADDLADMRALQKHKAEMVHESKLKDHERNYREHPEDQVEHLMASLKEHGFYRNIVVASDDTVLAGHGILEAARRVGLKKIPVTRLSVGPDHPEALKIVAGDNELGRLAELDDRQLSMMLKEVADSGDVSALLGTGYDAQTLAALVMVTRPSSEIRDFNEAAEWVGLPGFEAGQARTQLVVTFEAEGELSAGEVREQFCKERLDGHGPHYKRGGDGYGNNTWSTWWPPRAREDLKGVRFEG